MKVITVSSQKGGVAKTTTAVTLATGLAIGAKTLLVDFDPQGQAAISLGVDPAPGVFNFFVNGSNAMFCDTKHVFLLPGNTRTRTAETVLRSEQTIDQIIDRFSQLLPYFDFIVIDTPPGGLFQELAIRRADMLIIPVRCEALGLDGVMATMEMAGKISQATQTYILPTMYDKRLKEHRANLEMLTERYGGMVLTPVPLRTAVAEAVALGCTVWETSAEDVQLAYTRVLDKIWGVDNG